MTSVESLEDEAHALLGIRVERAGELVVMRFDNGNVEHWAPVCFDDPHSLEQLECLSYGGGLYVKLPDRES